MKNKLFFGLLVAFVTISFTLSALASGLAPDGFPFPRVVKDRPIQVGVLFQNLSGESVIRNYQQAKIEGAHRGWDAVLQPGSTDMERRDIMKAFIARNVDAIIIGCMPMIPLKDLIPIAREKGIGVYNVDTQIMSGVIANCTQSNAVAASKLFYKVGEDLLWQGKVCINTNQVFQVSVERTETIKGIIRAYPGVELLSEEFNLIGAQDNRQQVFDFTQRWITKYRDDLDVIVCDYDGGALGATNALMTSGFDQTQIFVIGIDGGSESWSYIRERTPFKYSYAQPFELYQHIIWELVDQIQIKGLKPGDEGCLIDKYGETIYAEGIIVSADNVPAPGESVHAVFNYYGRDPNDTDAWYNWQEAGGPYKVGTGKE